MRKAFTMAEVLITLGVIGIVAALTIPQLIKNYQHKALETAFKKQYSLLTQVFSQMNADGLCTTWDCSRTGQLYRNLTKYFKVVKYCDDMDGIEVDEYDKFCFPKNKNDTKYTNYTRTSSYVSSLLFDDGQFYTADGALYTLERSLIDKAEYIGVDVNGRMKGPNALGHDLFVFQVLDKGSIGVIFPMGADGTKYYKNTTFCSKTSTSNVNGIGCAVKALGEKDYFKNLP